MKQRLFSKLNLRLFTLLLLLATGFIVHSCKKGDASKQEPEALNTNMLNQARQWYNATYKPQVNKGKLAVSSIGSSPQG